MSKKTKSTKQATIAPRQLSVEEKVQSRYAYLSVTIDADIRKAMEAVELHAQKITDAASSTNPFGTFIYQLEWMEGPAAQVAYGFLLAGVEAYRKHFAEERGMSAQESLCQALKTSVERASDDLLSNRLAGRSSSPFHNAMEAARREAASRFVRMYADITREFNELLEEQARDQLIDGIGAAGV